MSQKNTALLMLDEYEEKPFGWDGDKGLPVRRDAIDLVRRLLHDDEFVTRRVDMCHPVGVILNANGTITITLEYDHRAVIMTFECGSAISYAQMFEDGVTSLDGAWRIIKTGDFVRVVRFVNTALMWLTRDYH